MRRITKLLSLNLAMMLLVAVSCSDKKSAPDSNEIFVDFKSESPMVINSPEDNFNYSDYIDSVVYVPLETTDDCLVGEFTDMHFVNDRIFVKSGFSIFIFGKDGKFISKISRRGRGHGEYNNMAGWDVNPSNNEISIYSNADETVYVYSIQGNFLRSVRLGEGIHRDFCVLPNGNYLFYTPDYMKNHYRGVLQTDPEGKIINQPLVLSGSARKCILFSKNFVHLSNGQVGLIGPFGFDNIYHINTDISEIAYHITTNVTIAQSVLEDDTPGSFMEQELYCLENYLETDNLVTFHMSNMKDKSVDVKYDKQTSKTFCRSMKWGKDQPQILGTHFLPGDKMLWDDGGRWADYGVVMSEHSASSIMQMPEEYRNKIAPDCTMDSNPVVCLYYYKQTSL